MIVVNLVGGLASQLHKYMLALSIGQKLKKQVKVDLSFFTEEMYQYNNIMKYELPNLGLNPDIASKKEVALAKGHTTASYVVMNLFKLKVLNEFFFNLPARIAGRLGRALKSSGIMFKEYIYIHIADKDFDPEWLEKIPANIKAIYLDGEPGFDIKLIESVRVDISKNISELKFGSDSYKSYLQKIKQAKNPVAVHVRRGDYVDNKEVNEFIGVCAPQYYVDVINILNKNVDEPVFYIFSDDMDFAKNCFKGLDSDIVYVESNSSFEDFSLLVNCSYHAISNSGFSSLGAYLSGCPEGNVYAPIRFYLDRITNSNTFKILPVGWNFIDT